MSLGVGRVHLDLVRLPGRTDALRVRPRIRTRTPGTPPQHPESAPRRSPSRTRCAQAARKSIELVPCHCSSSLGNSMPRSPRAAAPSKASQSACTATSASEVPSRPSHHESRTRTTPSNRPVRPRVSARYILQASSAGKGVHPSQPKSWPLHFDPDAECDTSGPLLDPNLINHAEAIL